MSIVDRRMLRNRCGAPHILVALLVDKCVELLIGELSVVDEDMIMHGTSCALDGAVRTQVEIVLERCGDAGLDERSGEAIAILVTLAILGKESVIAMDISQHVFYSTLSMRGLYLPVVVALSAHEHDKWDVELRIRRFDESLHICHLLFQHVRVHAF